MKIKTKFILILSLLIATLVGVTISAKRFLDINEQSLNNLRDRKLAVLLNDRDNVVFLDVYLKDIEVALSTREIQILSDSESLLEKIADGLAKTGIILNRDHTTSANDVLALAPQTKNFVQILLNGDPASSEVQSLAGSLNSFKAKIQEDLAARQSDSERDFNNTLKEIQHYNEMSATVYPLAIGVLSFVVIVLASLILGTMFSRIEKLRKHFSLSDLDSLQTFDSANTNDELGALVQASNRMLTGFKDSRKQLVDKKFLDNILESLVDLLVVVDTEGKIIRCNQKALDELQLNRDQLADFRIFHLMTVRINKDGYQSVKDITDALIRGVPVKTEINFRRSDGTMFPVLISGARMDGAADKITLVISARDITDMIKAQDEKTEMQKQLTHAARLASLGTLGAGVAHELNNPLVGVRGYAELISSDGSASELMQSFAKKIVTATDRMRKIIDHLRTFSADTSGRERTPVDINANIADSLILLRTQLTVHNINVETNFDTDLPLLMGDSNQLESIFQNLIINARDALCDVTDNRTKLIKIKTWEGPNKSALIEISDNANGIPEHIINSVWDPFFTTKDVGKGTGLGLSIVQGIVKDHDGEIGVRTETGKGTVFNISFSGSNTVIATKSVESNRSSVPLFVEAVLAEPVKIGPRPRCVIIDDEEMVADILTMYIETNYDVIVFNDSKKAVESFLDEKYDLIITDMKMPGLSGIEVIKHGRQKQPQAKIVVITGHAKTDAEVEEAMSLGASLVIPKPFPDRKQIIALLTGLMNEEAGTVAKKSNATRPLRDPHSEAVVAPKVAPALEKTSILIIDDETEILEILELFLSSQFSVTTTPHAAEAEVLIRSGKFAVIITDMLMPDTSGPKILALSKEHSPRSRIIAISGKSENDPECLEMLKNGASSVVTKPFRSREAVVASVTAAIALVGHRRVG